MKTRSTLASPDPRVLAAVLHVSQLYLHDHTIIHFDDAASNEALFGGLARLRAARRRPRICLAPGCSDRTVSASHTVPRTGSLATIANGGHVITPQLRWNDGRLAAVRIGVGRASVFPGFCARHELLFRSFEHSGEIATDGDVARQLFRSVCRERVRLEITVAFLEDQLDNYREYRRRALESLIRDRVSGQNFRLQNVCAEDPPEHMMREKLEAAREELRAFQDDFYPLAVAGLDDPTAGLVGTALLVDQSIPICLSGRGNFHVARDGGIRNVRVLLAVIPGRRSTFISLGGLPSDRVELEVYRDSRMRDGLQLLGAIESWMIHGTDHWYLSPTVWDRILESHQRQVLDDILDESRSIGREYSKSIFNDLRRELIALAESSDQLSAEERALISMREKEKLTDA